MSKVKYWGVTVLIGLLLCIAYWWATIDDRSDPLNNPVVFIYSDNSMLSWFNLSIKNGKVKGNLYQHKVIEEIGEVPVIEKKTYPLTGKVTEKGYEFRVQRARTS
ncbi:hypothetical protein [Fredinandcohnia quinoae]|uniref:Uncharacterized protein n=1 Tax=Fredinandcohnia quinoae TaxID=2918902 RepID=A0AAW5EFW0_9BACI|nr:hypothetical protein [Fredinandcohnia sp. SECRCQ15]MCH1627729.1 hypothetical protein [Fredinandcohnia sp. SECRCQ15]